jgi:predicted O-linked N-acetylglucosamine transferase (SPINDLY family)
MKLIGRVLELHDSSRFDVTLYCHTNPKNLATNTFDRSRWGRIVELEGVSDAEAAAKMRQDGIDILVDLKGHTNDRAALRRSSTTWPRLIQTSWLGFPGSTRQYRPRLRHRRSGTCCPITSKPHYPREVRAACPKPIRRTIRWVGRSHGTDVTRAQHGLPDDTFVFASFNANRKITSQMLSTSGATS